MTEVWQLALPPGEKLTLLALADNANDEGVCWPSINNLSIKTSMHRTSVMRILGELESRRLITRSSDSGRSNTYQIHLQNQSHHATSSKTRLVAPCDGGSSVVRLPVVAPCDGGSSVVRPRTIIEPSIEPSLNHHKDVPHETLEQVKAVYPEGGYNAVTWMAAEREIGRLLEQGETPIALIASAAAYSMQQQARGNTTHLYSPANFFGRGYWQGPFPMPKSKAESKQDANLSASLAWLAAGASP